MWGDEREEEIIVQASSYPPLSYQCQSLPFDDYFDAEIRLKDGVRSYRTQVDFIHHEERSIFSFERVHCFQAPRIELLTSGVNFANNFFRVDEVIKIGCPRFINCFIQEVIITPNQFEECMDFTTQIDGGEAPRYLTAKIFWVNGSLNFQDNMMNLAISNATVTLKTKDLYVPD
ncbi:MAG: hypothetical protein C0582_04780 [Alphaproteobacteria bacterium]|nr:MAG: hypothetical protein C0582_04780 [Alphaproteobacteria bacterium]